MEELHAVADDQSHYEISLTAGQAFAAFVLLLLSLAASFAFGLMMGKGQADDRLVVRREPPVVTEAALTPKKNADRIVELGVDAEEFQTPAADDPPKDPVAAVVEETAPVVTESTETAAENAPAAAAVVTPAAAPASGQDRPARDVTTYAQLLSTSDQKTAENLAARVIDRGFTSAYVERGSTEKGPIYRVRVKFDSEAEARNAEPKLKEFSREVWITTK